MLVYAATKNLGKVAELRAIFSQWGWRIAESAVYDDVVEGDASYEENAALKARALHAALAGTGEKAAVIGDDSGLEIDSLDGRPGVLSARYGGVSATWSERRRLLLGEIAAAERDDRGARFACALHFIGADGRECSVFEILDGRVSEHERGDGGFSYDAIFIPQGRTQTFAEISEAEKNRISHRARAARRLVAMLGDGGVLGPR